MSKALLKARERLIDAAAEPGKRAALYIRVSTKREEMISPELQENHGRSYCARKGYSVVAVEKDLGYSGGSSKLRKIGKMIQAVKDGEYDVIVVWQLSRWGRNLLDSLLNVHALQEAGGRLESATEGLESIETPFGEFSMGQLLLIAQLQRAQIRASWMDAHKHRVDAKLPHSGAARFGYVYHIRQKEKRQEGIAPELLGTYEVDPVTGPVLAGMYRAFIDGRSFISIARDLNARGITGILGGRWTHATVRQTLDTGFGAGYFRFQQMYLPGKHEAVIKEQEWTRYVSRRLDGEKEPARTTGQKAKFKRMVKCDRCSRRMSFVNHRMHKTMANGQRKTYVYEKWKCAGQGGAGTCKSILIAGSVVEEAVKAWLEREHLGDPGTSPVTRKMDERRARSNIRKLKAEISRVKAAQTRLLDMYLEGGFSKEQLDDKKERLTAELIDYELQLAESEADLELAEVPLSTAYEALLDAWDVLDADLFNIGLSKVIDEIRIHPDGARPEGRVEIIPRRLARVSAA